jgi:hypothetical protein
MYHEAVTDKYGTEHSLVKKLVGSLASLQVRDAHLQLCEWGKKIRNQFDLDNCDTLEGSELEKLGLNVVRLIKIAKEQAATVQKLESTVKEKAARERELE